MASVSTLRKHRTGINQTSSAKVLGSGLYVQKQEQWVHKRTKKEDRQDSKYEPLLVVARMKDEEHGKGDQSSIEEESCCLLGHEGSEFTSQAVPSFSVRHHFQRVGHNEVDQRNNDGTDIREV